MEPDFERVSKKNQEEFSSLANRRNHLNKVEMDKIKEDYNQLLQHQNKLQDLNILPTINLEDISDNVERVDTQILNLAHGKFIK